MSAVDDVFGEIVTREKRPFSEVARGYTAFRENDVLMAKITPCMENGKAAIARNLTNGYGYGSTEFHVLRAGATLLPEWLYFIVRTESFRAAAAASFQGAVGQRRVPEDFVSGFRVPLPPLSEQQRIVDLLKEAEAIRRLRSDAETQSAAIIPALFFDMFGDLSANSKNWPVQKISDFVESFEGGKSLSEHGVDSPNGLRVLKISAVTSGRFIAAESKPVAPNYTPPEHHFVRRGDLLISRANTAELVGATALVEDCPPNILLPDKLWRFVWKEPEQVSVEFMAALFQTKRIREGISRLATGTGGSMKNISMGRLMELRVPLPPAKQQLRFTQALGELRGIHAEAAKESRMERLRLSLLAHGFTGELTAEWREKHAKTLETEARDRDRILNESGAPRGRRATIQEMDAIFERRTDGIHAQLTEEQYFLLEDIQRGYDGVDYARWFTAHDLAPRVRGRLCANPQGIAGHLAVFAARGLLIALSREQADAQTGEVTFGDAYRLPLRDREAREGDPTEPRPGDRNRHREIARLADAIFRQRPA
jgi:type I restriction enzyme S subunit